MPGGRSLSRLIVRRPNSRPWTTACARGLPAVWWSRWDRSAKNCGLKSSSRASRLPGRITRFDVPAAVLEYLAQSITHNGRDLEGAINRLLAHSTLSAQPVTLEMAEREVRDLIRPQEPKRIKIEDIQRVVARQYNVSRSDLLSSRRTANVVRPAKSRCIWRRR